MKRETKLVLPSLDNQGRSLQPVHERLALELTRLFGGLTASESNVGFWLAPTGQLAVEPVNVYYFAADNDEATRFKVTEIAKRYGTQAGQHTVYLQHGNGEVQLIELEPANDNEFTPSISADKAGTYIM